MSTRHRCNITDRRNDGHELSLSTRGYNALLSRRSVFDNVAPKSSARDPKSHRGPKHMLQLWHYRRCHSECVWRSQYKAYFRHVNELAHATTQYVRGDDLQCLLHLRGLRAMIFNRPGGLSSLREEPKLFLLVSL